MFFHVISILCEVCKSLWQKLRVQFVKVQLCIFNLKRCVIDNDPESFKSQTR